MNAIKLCFKTLMVLPCTPFIAVSRIFVIRSKTMDFLCRIILHLTVTFYGIKCNLLSLSEADFLSGSHPSLKQIFHLLVFWVSQPFMTARGCVSLINV